MVRAAEAFGSDAYSAVPSNRHNVLKGKELPEYGAIRSQCHGAVRE